MSPGCQPWVQPGNKNPVLPSPGGATETFGKTEVLSPLRGSGKGIICSRVEPRADALGY